MLQRHRAHRARIQRQNKKKHHKKKAKAAAAPKSNSSQAVATSNRQPKLYSYSGYAMDVSSGEVLVSKTLRLNYQLHQLPNL